MSLRIIPVLFCFLGRAALHKSLEQSDLIVSQVLISLNHSFYHTIHPLLQIRYGEFIAAAGDGRTPPLGVIAISGTQGHRDCVLTDEWRDSTSRAR